MLCHPKKVILLHKLGFDKTEIQLYFKIKIIFDCRKNIWRMLTTQKYKENIHKCYYQDKECHQSTKITKLSKSYHSNKDGNAKNVHNCTSVWKFCTQGYYSMKVFQICSLHSVSNTRPGGIFRNLIKLPALNRDLEDLNNI